jgi:AhpC/TSA family
MEGAMKVLSTLLLALALCILHAAVPAQTNGASAEPAAELKTLTDDYGKAERAFLDTFHTAKTDAERDELWKTQHPARDFLPRFQALAQRAQGTETGARALIWVLEKGENAGRRDAAREALRTLTTAYVQSPVIEDAARNLGYLSQSIGTQESASALRAIIEQSPHPRVRAAATFTLATLLLRSAEGGKSAQTEARRLFDRVRKDYSATPYAGQAASYIFELENLQVGMKAPDLEATDQDGRSFKLSEYRGKVVVLDFWGFW